MADAPILIFPRPAPVEKDERTGGGPVKGAPYATPSRDRQEERLGEQFDQVIRSFGGLQATMEGLEPEQVLVLEVAFEKVAGSMEVADALANYPELEWLAELDLQDELLQEFGKPEKPTARRLYAFFSTQLGAQQLSLLRRKWTAGENMPTGYSAFNELFKHVDRIRPWGPEDRYLDTGVLDWWRERLDNATGPIRFEVELWYRSDLQRRAAARQRLSEIVAAAGGSVLHACDLDEVAYHGVLVECPRETVEALMAAIDASTDTELLRCDEIMFFRGCGQSSGPLNDPDGGEVPGIPAAPVAPLPTGEPLIALLDGLPLSRHRDLDGRLRIDDPDDFADGYAENQRRHGTAMASLLAHGDLAASEPPTPRSIYVRPVMRPEEVDGEVKETYPQDRLFIDLFHRAVLRIVRGDGEEAPAARSVKIINVSLGDRGQPFIRNTSPLARLIDWLAFEYRLLFVIGAGNFEGSIDFDVSRAELDGMEDGDAAFRCLEAMQRQVAQRRLFAPAEALNAITVGALHADAAGPFANHHNMSRDLLRGRPLPSPVSMLGRGLHQAVKPEILLPGGRQYYSERIGGALSYELNGATRLPGQSVACPGLTPGVRTHRLNARGSSNAAATGSRLAAAIYDRLREAEVPGGGPDPSPDDLILMTKALLVHGADWDRTSEAIDPLCGPRTPYKPFRGKKAAFIGFGPVTPDRSMKATDQRIILAGSGYIQKEQGHAYSVPIPTRLSGEKYRRRLTITLAWLSPTNLRHRNYRRADLWVSLQSEVHGLLPTTGNVHVPGEAAKGTVQHLVYESDNALAVEDGKQLTVKVNCRAGAGELIESVPYGIAVTLEIADAEIPGLRDEMRDRLRPAVPADVASMA